MSKQQALETMSERAVRLMRGDLRMDDGSREDEVRAMQAEAEQWARVGWRDVQEQDAAIAAGCNRAADAILAVREEGR